MISYGVAALFCLAFSIIYEHFSHGVRSAFMELMCLFPLFGCISYVFFLIKPRHYRDVTLCRYLFPLSIITLTMGSLISGVLEIYGTKNRLTTIYFPVGSLLFLINLIMYLVKRHKSC